MKILKKIGLEVWNVALATPILGWLIRAAGMFVFSAILIVGSIFCREDD